MWKTILRRFLVMIPQILILSILLFILADFMPGDPFTGIVTPDMDPEAIANLREMLGYNDPLPVRYVRWLGDVLQGDFGHSQIYSQSVISAIGPRMRNTILLSIVSTVLTYSIGIPLGLLSGRYNGTILDKAVILYNFISFAVPTFLLALLVAWLFGYILEWFPASGSIDVRIIGQGRVPELLSRLNHLILPAVTAAVLGTTSIIQYLRSETIDAKTSDYVRTARSKGVPIKKVYSQHIFRNASLPIASGFGFVLVNLLAGTVFIETVFAYQGMGQLFIEAINRRDYALIYFLVLFYGFTGLVGTLLSDISLMIVDPRIRID